MIDLHWLYVLAGAVFAAFAISSARDRTNPKRLGNTAFWSLLAVSFWFGDFLGDVGNGVLVLALVAIAGGHLLGKGSRESTTNEERRRFSDRFGNKLFLPALIIPFTAFVGTLASNAPIRTTGSKLNHATTLFDYIRRAMPWNETKSLSGDELYAVSAYILNLNGVIGETEVLDAQSLPKVQMPNRDGFVLFPRQPK